MQWWPALISYILCRSYKKHSYEAIIPLHMGFLRRDLKIKPIRRIIGPWNHVEFYKWNKTHIQIWRLQLWFHFLSGSSKKWLKSSWTTSNKQWMKSDDLIWLPLGQVSKNGILFTWSWQNIDLVVSVHFS